MKLMDIMWPASQSHFYLLFIFIEMNFIHCHSCVMFTIHKFLCVHFRYKYFDHPINDNLVESHTSIIFNSNNANFMSCLSIPNLNK